MEEDETDLEKMMTTFEKTTMTGLDLIEYYEKLNAKVDALKTIDISRFCNLLVFEEGDVDRNVLKTMIGETQDVQQDSDKVEMISSFQHKESTVCKIFPFSRDEAWLTYLGAKEFSSLKRNGHPLMSVQKDTQTHQFILQNNLFLLCNLDKKNIMQIEMTGRSSVWMDTSPLMARFIGMALSGNVLISLCDEYSGTRTEQSQRSVRMVTPSGDVLHSYEYGEDGITPVLKSPSEVTQNYNSDVCVVNMYEKTTYNWRGNLCSFYEDGGLKFIYNGHGGEFLPCGICCDSLCNIICANYFDDTIHVVSSEGAFSKYLFTRDTCMEEKKALALHRNRIWVGSDRGEVRVYRYTHGNA